MILKKKRSQNKIVSAVPVSFLVNLWSTTTWWMSLILRLCMELLASSLFLNPWPSFFASYTVQWSNHINPIKKIANFRQNEKKWRLFQYYKDQAKFAHNLFLIFAPRYISYSKLNHKNAKTKLSNHSFLWEICLCWDTGAITQKR